MVQKKYVVKIHKLLRGSVTFKNTNRRVISDEF